MDKPCKRCGNTFNARSHRYLYCKTCQPLQKAAYRRAWHEANGYKRNTGPYSATKQCKTCGVDFHAYNGMAKYCPDHTRHSNRYIPQKRRYLVFERDNFQCQYCGRSPKLHKAVLEIDHIIPVSQGGDNQLSNLTTACKRCNRCKADTPTVLPATEVQWAWDV